MELGGRGSISYQLIPHLSTVCPQCDQSMWTVLVGSLFSAFFRKKTCLKNPQNCKRVGRVRQGDDYQY